MPRRAVDGAGSVMAREATGLARTRRHFFHECGVGVGKIALAGLLAEATQTGRAGAELPASAAAMAGRPPHFPGTAKAVIQLFMAGAPSQLDMFD